MSTPLVVRSERVVLPDGMRPASIHVRDGRIADVRDYAERTAGVRELDAGDLVVLPGLVDTHVHINDPGRTDWEGFEHATKAAAAGGVTTLVDMPLNSIPPTTDVAGLEAKRRAATGRCHVDVGFWGGVVPGNSGALEPLARAGVLGFKCFLSPVGRRGVRARHRSRICARRCRSLARLGLPLLAHAEWPPLLRDPSGDATRVRDVARQPAARERAGGHRAARRGLPREYGARVHIVHLASAGALAGDSRRPRRGSGGHRRDLPALSHLRRRRDSRRRDRVQVRAADPRARPSGAALAGAQRRGHRPHRHRSLPVAAGAEAPGRRRLRRRLGRHRLAPARSRCGVDRRVGARRLDRGARAMALPRPRAPRRPRPRQGCDRGWMRCRSRHLGSGRRPPPSMPRALYHRHPVTPYRRPPAARRRPDDDPARRGRVRRRGVRARGARATDFKPSVASGFSRIRQR